MSEQGNLFDGITFDAERDTVRLSKLLGRVREFMSDGAWHDLHSISKACGGTEASVSARLRDLRKQRFGNHSVERCNTGGGRWVYRLRQSDERAA